MVADILITWHRFTASLGLSFGVLSSAGFHHFHVDLFLNWMFPVGLGFVIGFFILLLYWASPLIQNWKIVLLTFYLVVRFGISNESNCLIVF